MIKNVSELKAKQEEALAKMNSSKEGEALTRVVVGMATCGIAAGATPVYEAINKTIKSLKLKNISLIQTGCIGMCQYEPIVEVTVPGEDKVTYVKMNPEKSVQFVTEHLKAGRPVAELTVSAVTE